MFDNLSSNQILMIVVVIVGIIFAVMYFTKPKITPNRNPYPKKRTYNTITQTAPQEKNKSNDEQNRFTLYNFYSPKCGWSVKFMPDWNKVANQLNNSSEQSSDISVKSIDVTKPENENLAFYYNITAYPTIILTTPNRNIEYSGDRSPNDLINFVKTTMAEY